MNSKVICIDASRYGDSQATGTERYSFEIINRLFKLATHHGYKLRLYVREYLPNFPAECQEKINCKRLWTLAGLSLQMLRKKPDVLFVPSHVLPLIRAKKNIIMIHDVAFARYPKIYTWRQRFYLNWSTKYAIKHAEKIIVPSELTAEDLRTVFKCPADKIEVIRHGVNELPEFTDEDRQACFKKFGITDNYLLFLGRIEHKKNVVRLIRAFISISQHLELKLVLGGKPGFGYELIRDIANKCDISDRIIFTDYLTEIEKAVLLKNAFAFVFPSLYEGFGMPVLEAMKACVPVIASDISVLREVGGKACYYVDPLSEEDLARAISEIMKDREMRDRMIKLGREQIAGNEFCSAKQLNNKGLQSHNAPSALFDWDKSAERTWRLISF